MDEALARLAAAAGIEPGYWDGLGTRRDLGSDTAQALLAALGFDPAGDLAAQARALEERDFAAGLAPAILLAADAATTLLVAADAGRHDQPVAWTLDCEDGRYLAGTARLEHHHEAGERMVDGRARWRYRISPDLAVPLPPGCHRLHLDGLGTTTLIVTPAACHLSGSPGAGSGRVWGLAVQLYSLTSARNWGIGDFGDLAALARIAGAAGAALIGLNPLHARHLARPDEASPYAPSSRLMLDPMYLEVAAIADHAQCAEAQAIIADAGFQARLAAARAAPLVDHAAVAALKLPVLGALYRHFRTHHADPATPRGAAYAAFRTAGGRTLADFAVFEALRLTRLAERGHLPGWRDWEPEWHSPDSPALAGFAARHPEAVDFQCYLQWQADLQLGAAAAAARDAGMSLGLYRDLAVGAADDGAETWAAGDLIARGASVGAPPDLLNREGQDWGLPPWNPRALAARAYAPFRALLAANMRHAGALRIDHVMALTRLFWIPAGRKGDAGGYVRQAFDALAGLVALESVRNRCLVVGEDLGSVPDGLREALAARGLLSYRVLLFERHWNGDGSFKRPWEYPRQALATAVTHDMATIAEWWDGGDVPRRAALGLFPDPALADAEGAQRGPEREGLARLAAELQIAAPGADGRAPAATLHAMVACTDAMLAVVQLDDIAGETDPVNIPGTYREYPNWRRKVGLAIEDLALDPRFIELARTMREAGRAAPD